MSRKMLKRAGIGLAGLLIGGLALVATHTYTGTNIYPNLDKQHAMLRLEDVGPLGEYGSLEGLGKLRAVLEYIESERIPYHIAVIPRMMRLEPDGSWAERGIDDPEPDEIAASFIRLLQAADGGGGILGMHGYSHQYGAEAREDGGQDSGTGSEFKIKGAPETHEPSYAAARITNSLAAFAKAGLQPAFWESPHYHDTRKQEEVFRSHMGLLYQPDLLSLRSLKDMNQYDTVNTYGQSSLGSVYVPAPFRYVSDSSSVNAILSKASKSNALASMYYHPFLEFPFLEQVKGPDGKPLMKQGLPIYQYTETGAPSHLRRLLEGMRQLGYRWMSIHDIVPYSPAHRITLPPQAALQDVLLGHVTGGGTHADVIIREAHRILVIPGTYTWPRNRPQEASEVWLKESFASEERLLLIDVDQDGNQELLAYNSRTGAVRVSKARDRQFLPPQVIGTLPDNLRNLQVYPFPSAQGLIAREAQGELLLIRMGDQELHYSRATLSPLPEDAVLYSGAFLSKQKGDILYHTPGTQQPLYVIRHLGNGSFSEPQVVEGLKTIEGNHQLLIGDSNGDGLDDLITYYPEKGIWRVYQNEGKLQFRPLANDFGPWAQGKSRTGVIYDFDGNGKADLGAYDQAKYILDLALSYRGMTP